MSKKWIIFSVVAILALALSACGGAATEDGTMGTATLDAGGAPIDESLDEGMDVTMTPEAGLGDGTETEDMTATGTPEASLGDDDGSNDMESDGLAEDSPYRFTSLNDYDVVDSEGDTVADVEGFLIDRQAGQIQYVLVGAGGVLGIGEKDILVPFGALSTDGSMASTADDMEESFTLNVDRQVIEDAPNFDGGAYPDTTASGWDGELRTYWGGIGVPVTGGVGADGPEGQSANLVLLRDVSDVNVVSNDGEDIGDIEDFIVDPQSGQVRYVILATGGALDMGECFMPLPWSALNWEVDASAMSGGSEIGMDGEGTDADGTDAGQVATLDPAAGDADAGEATTEPRMGADGAVEGQGLMGPYTVAINMDMETLNAGPCFENLEDLPAISGTGWEAEWDSLWMDDGSMDADE